MLENFFAAVAGGLLCGLICYFVGHRDGWRLAEEELMTDHEELERRLFREAEEHQRGQRS